jgi:uncharacterized delta-60 repeat protein
LAGSVLLGLAVTACGDDDAPEQTDGGAEATDGGGSGGTEPGPDGGKPAPWEIGKKSTGGADPTKEDRYYTPVFDAAGNVYAIGYVNDAGNRSVVIAKYDQNGVLVTSGWGTGGVVELDYNPYAGDADNILTSAADDKFASAEEGRDLAFQADGKLVFVAVVEEVGNTFNRQLVVRRVNADGTPDATFNDDTGTAVIDWSPTPDATNTTNDTVWGLDVDANGKIYVFGAGRARAGVLTTTDRFITRLKANGTVDETFANAEGTFTIDTPTNSANVPAPPAAPPTFLGLGDNARHGFALEGGGCMSVGYTNVAGRNQIVVWKLKEDGTRDVSFSGDGIARVNLFPNGVAEAYGAAVLSDGSFVTTGYGTVNVDLPANLDVVSTTLTPAGAVDNTFGVAGSLAIDLAGAEERGRYALALPGDRLLFAGAGSPTAGNKEAMLVLLEKDGTPVANFGPDGRQLYDFGTVNEEFHGAALSTDGKRIAAAGYTAPPAAQVAEGNGFIAILPVGE